MRKPNLVESACPPGLIIGDALYSDERLKWELQLTNAEWREFKKADLTYIRSGKKNYFFGKEVIEWMHGLWVSPGRRKEIEERELAKSLMGLRKHGVKISPKDEDLIAKHFPKKTKPARRDGGAAANQHDRLHQ